MKSIIEWFVDNPIAANLLMLIIIFVGLKNIPIVGKSVLPQTEFSYLDISASYSAASPKSVEQQVIIRLEEAIADLEGIDTINSIAREGSAKVSIAVLKGYDSQRLFNKVKSRIDALTTLPDEVDNIQVSEFLPKRPLMSIAIHGNVEEALLKSTAQWLRDELSLLEAVSTVGIEDVRKSEMAIEVSERTLRRYGLQFDQIATAIRQSSLSVPGGVIKTDAGRLQIQTRGQAYSAEQFGSIVVATTDDGAQLLLGDIAKISDGFEEVDRDGSFNGEPAAYLELYTTSPPDVLEAAQSAREKVDELRNRLPPGVELTIWVDRSTWFTSRMNLLLKNAVGGLLLVFIVLMLFLTPSLAAWVSLGIATAFMGVFVVLPYAGVTINMLSMYGFLLALGIVVDDAIIVGESIYTCQRRGQPAITSAKNGTLFVKKPVLFAVISTIMFFSGMFGLPGWMGSLAYPIAVVVMICLFFSLVESFLILPSHLSHYRVNTQEKNGAGVFNQLENLRNYLSLGMEKFASNVYRPFLEKSLKNNSQTLMYFLMGLLIIAVVYFSGGYLKTSFRVTAVSNNIRLSALLAEGVSFSETRRIKQQIEEAVSQLEDDKHLKNLNKGKPFVRAVRSIAENNKVRVWVALLPTEQRTVNIIQVKNRLRELMGPLVGVKEFNLRFTINTNNKPIRFRVSVAGNNNEQLSASVKALRKKLQSYKSVYDIEDNLESVRNDIELRLKPNAELLGLSLMDVASQVRQGFYGEEVQRIPRGTEDIKVMLRYPLSERRYIENIEQLYIKTADGRSVPLSAVAEVVDVPGYSIIRRENRRRTIMVSANVTEGVDALMIAQEIVQQALPLWQQQYQGLSIEMAGPLSEQQEFNWQLLLNMLLAIFASYSLMAIVFRSYWQPVLVLTAIPYGFIGAVIGHLIMGETINMMSMLGFLACAGVVINDNLVLLDRIHQLHNSETSIVEAVVQAGHDRFRAIILTSLTTFIGLLPILFETSVQAQFLIPMVVSLSFGVLFSTLVTLLLVPNLYLLGERFRVGFIRIVTKQVGLQELK